MVVHYWSNAGEEGFYLSHGLVEGSYNDEPVKFRAWQPLGIPPDIERPIDITERFLREQEG